jgi:hypothetical protein
MHITLAQLEAFFWTARLDPVQQAAQQLNLAQPTVSLRLRDLQQQLGGGSPCMMTLAVLCPTVSALEHEEIDPFGDLLRRAAGGMGAYRRHTGLELAVGQPGEE